MIAAIDLGDALADIATALRVPVLVAAVVILLLCALELGRFAPNFGGDGCERGTSTSAS